MRGYGFLYVLPTYEAWGTSGIIRYIKVCVIANCVITSQFSMELVLFGCGLSVIVHNSKVYVKSRVVILRFNLYPGVRIIYTRTLAEILSMTQP